MNDRHEAANLEQIRLLLEGLQPAPTSAAGSVPQEAAPEAAAAPAPDTGPDTTPGDRPDLHAD
ncbi:hypothetical protein [Deinococcus sp. LM3]|uniref:hypothetical protein n=1 Tax=Deinococcus sp. LM3 TaxID=1938608 RepID=UPI00099400A7|nr:hypothetical protein [Deinococcus sp. LM3]OOV12458.1 hypothetical protein BXU09_16820 [Deinococcus sp. LM3]